MNTPPGWTLLHTLRAHAGPIRQLVWSQDGLKLGTPGHDGLLIVWDAQTGKPLRVIRHGTSVLAAAFSPDAENIASSVMEDNGVSAGFEFSPFDEQEPFSEELDELLGDYATSSEWNADTEDMSGLTVAVVVADTDSGTRLANFIGEGLHSPPEGVAWASIGRLLYTASTDGLAAWQVRTGTLIQLVDTGPIHSLALSPDEQAVAVVGYDYWQVWGTDYGLISEWYQSEESQYTDVAWSPGGALAIGRKDGTVEVVNPMDPTSVRYLEGHTRAITSVSFSDDGRLLASKSLDGTVRLWDCVTWDAVSTLHEPARGQSSAAGIAFAPTDNVLATLGAAGKVVRIWRLDIPAIMARKEISPTIHYSNAKVVLLGDSGVGKTGLGLVLSGQPFQATESSHGRNVWLLEAEEHAGEPPERHETYLWDLAGQPGYRLLHQLHLGDVAVAVVVFDARGSIDPFAGVRHWVRALRHAELSTGKTLPKLLVAARMDRGGPEVSDGRIEQELDELELYGYLQTSAKEGLNIEELSQWIMKAIPWDQMPKVSSTGLFDSIKSFLVAKRDQGDLLVRDEELLKAYVATQSDGSSDFTSLRDEFSTCVGRVAARGLIRRLSFGGLVLLRPEVLDAYAAALVNAARDEPDGAGAISEDRARAGDFSIPPGERLGDPDLEKLLLTATVEEVLRHEVALREQSDEGPFLVFPTQSRREAPAFSEPDSVWLTVTFEGAVQNVYATMVVRLSHSGLFKRAATFHNATTFSDKGDAILGVAINEPQEGEGVLRLFSSTEVDRNLQSFFADYIVAHVRRRALADTVNIDRALRCGGCGLEVTDQLRRLAQARGRDHISCPVCDQTVDIMLREEEDANELVVRSMDTSADEFRDRVAAKTVLAGKEEMGEFDVFLAHHNQDKPAVRRLADNLRDNGINPWLDDEQIPPGRWFQDEIQSAIGVVRSAAIVIGTQGLGKWEVVELRAFLQECVDREVPVIPVLLPGAGISDDLRILQQLRWVRFAGSVDEEEGVRQLVWGIEGRQGSA